MIVTLLTDFGTADHFVAAMKGVVLSLAPDATLVDVTHQVPPQDVRAGAFTLLAAHDAFPAGTIHLAVVDPGVGSARRPIVAAAGGHLFVGPDNGLFGHLYDLHPGARVFHLSRERYFRHPVSTTFHGRDVFAPVAGALASGATPEEVGEEVTDPVRLDPLLPRRAADGGWEGVVLHVDHFGNCITGLTRAELPDDEALAHGLHLRVAGREIRSFQRFYAQEGTLPGHLFAIWGSAGFLEIVAFRDSAARLLSVGRGAPVVVRLG